jgi:DNA-binding LacI/PurR family transcriptional regulator
MGVMRAMYEADRPIPGQVSVVGFDDTPVAAFLRPALTTVRLDFAELGRASFAMLRNLVDPDAAIPLPPRPEPVLIIRESAGPPPDSAT